MLNRIAYGSRSGDLQKLQNQGISAYINEQLAPETIPEPASLRALPDDLDSLRANPMQLAQEFREQRRRQREVKRNNAEEPPNNPPPRFKTLVRDAAEARLIRAIYSPRRLQESLVEFWFNHFNVFAGKGLDRVLIADYEQRAIRPNVLGRFRDLLGATARHPAMLFYLDNWQNTAPDSPGARGRFKDLNENYARELMELHTLGVDGGYTQTDVISLARILTGWGLARPRAMQAGDGSGFFFDARRHDFGEKKLLGQALRGHGAAEVEEALDRLARHPSTARHISFKLAQYFVADDPPQALVDRMREEFLKTDGSIRAVLKVMFDSPEFRGEKYRNAKFKSPYHYVVSAVRSTGASVDNFIILLNFLKKSGMPLYGCVTPDGYQNTQAAWLNQSAMEQRLNFATALRGGNLHLSDSLAPISANGKILKPDEPVIRNRPQQPAIDPDRLALTLGNRFSENTRKALDGSPRPARAAMILGSPEFMRY